MAILIKNDQQIEMMREAGRIVAETHTLLAKEIHVGMSTFELDRIAETFIRSQEAVPSFLGYNGYPGSICVSINEEVVHGIPSKKRIIQNIFSDKFSYFISYKVNH
jgi:methionyl aminopeptidase